LSLGPGFTNVEDAGGRAARICRRDAVARGRTIALLSHIAEAVPLAVPAGPLTARTLAPA